MGHEFNLLILTNNNIMYICILYIMIVYYSMYKLCDTKIYNIPDKYYI